MARTTYARRTRSNGPKVGTTRLNQYAGVCRYCHADVAAGAGIIIATGSGWAVEHRPEQNVGPYPTVQMAYGCPKPGEPAAVPVAGFTPKGDTRGTGWRSSNSSTRGYRGRCEDAPCCGCCD